MNSRSYILSIPYWSILHSKVVGEDMSFLAEEQGHVVDRPVIERGQGQTSQPVRRALTNDRPETLDDWKKASGGMHNDKPLVEILRKNDKGVYE
jgi:hypothetical protein